MCQCSLLAWHSVLCQNQLMHLRRPSISISQPLEGGQYQWQNHSLNGLVSIIAQSQADGATVNHFTPLSQARLECPVAPQIVKPLISNGKSMGRTHFAVPPLPCHCLLALIPSLDQPPGETTNIQLMSRGSMQPHHQSRGITVYNFLPLSMNIILGELLVDPGGIRSDERQTPSYKLHSLQSDTTLWRSHAEDIWVGWYQETVPH